MEGGMVGFRAKFSREKGWGPVGVPAHIFEKKNNSIMYNPDRVIFEVQGHNRVAFWGILSHAGAKGIGLFRNQFINCKKVSVSQ